jgi:hypothetical protein
MATRQKPTNAAAGKSNARKELAGLLHGLSQLFMALEREIWDGKYRTAINAEERKDVHGACESCLDALTTVTLLPPPPEVGQRILQRFSVALAAEVGSDG